MNNKLHYIINIFLGIDDDEARRKVHGLITYFGRDQTRVLQDHADPLLIFVAVINVLSFVTLVIFLVALYEMFFR